MTPSIRYLLCLLVISSYVHGEPQEPAIAKIPAFLSGMVGGERLMLNILPENATPLERKLDGTRFINLEPGCIMLEAYVTLISEKKLEVRMPHDDGMTLRAMRQMGVRSKCFVVTFDPSDAANQAGSILKITSREQQPGDQERVGPPNP